MKIEIDIEDKEDLKVLLDGLEKCDERYSFDIHDFMRKVELHSKGINKGFSKPEDLKRSKELLEQSKDNLQRAVRLHGVVKKLIESMGV